MNKVNGFLYGLLSSASFGLIPLFTIPAMQAGMHFESILFYRFMFACMALGGILLIGGQSFRISRRDIPSLLLLALLYLMSAVFLFWGYKFMASGVATTIHFMYPVLTTLIMMLFFKEKKSGWRMAAIVSAITGVYFLSGGNTETGSISFSGLFIVLLSALGYALYLVTMSQLKIGRMKGLLLTFYVFLFGGRNSQPTATYQRMAYCRQPDITGAYPYGCLQPCTGESRKKHRLHTHLCAGSYGAGNCRMCRDLPFRRSFYHQYRCRYRTDYCCGNGYYIKTIKSAFSSVYLQFFNQVSSLSVLFHNKKYVADIHPDTTL